MQMLGSDSAKCTVLLMHMHSAAHECNCTGIDSEALLMRFSQCAICLWNSHALLRMAFSAVHSSPSVRRVTWGSPAAMQCWLLIMVVTLQLS